MDWRIKGAMQKLLAVVPGGHQFNSAMQLRIGGLRDVAASVDSKIVDDWLVMARQMNRVGIPVSGAVLLELGTGWFPTFPICFHLAGCDSCFTYDLHRLMNWSLTRQMVERVGAHTATIADALGIDEQAIRARWQVLAAASSVDDLLGRARIRYHAPADATRTGLGDATIDVVFSNSVLEHVRRETIAEFMSESHRVLKPGGVSIHSVNCGDHYAYFDKSITQINYLQFDERSWRIWNNDLQFQNRLRAHEFVQMAKDAKFAIVLDVQRPRPELLEALGRLSIAPQFRTYSPEQLCTTSVDFVARRPPTA